MASNPLKILTYLTASKDARFEETVNISGAVTAQNGVTVSGGDLNVSAGNISGSGTLQAGGAATLANGLTVTGAPVNASAVDVSASALNVTNNASVGSLNVVGNAVVGGNLTVQGTLTAIDSTTVNIGDSNINLITGSTDLAVAINGGGIDLGSGSLVQWRYDHANTAWTSNVDVNLGTDSEQYKISGSAVLTKTGTELQLGADVSSVMLANSTDLFVSGNMRLSGAADFDYITSVTRVDGLYDVDEAIQALDAAVSASFLQGSANTNAIKAAYNDLRAVVTGTLNAQGEAVVNLTSYSTASFTTAQSASIALDIMVASRGDGLLTNDLVAVNFSSSAGDLVVEINAPAAGNLPYRLIAVNEKDGGLG